MVKGTVTHPKPDCPDCGALMRLIPKGRGRTERSFWGCRQYPDCRGTLNIDPDNGRPIPREPLPETELSNEEEDWERW